MEPLNTNNYLNLVGYIVNTLVTFAASSIFGFPDNSALSEKYQTLVTPSGVTFAIWGIVFLFQGIFAIVQMLSKYRSTDIVQEGVSYWYFVACMFQAAWTFAFGYEAIWLSTIFMGGILAALFKIVTKQTKIVSTESGTGTDTDTNTNTNTTGYTTFWLFKFPFSIHFGWIAAAFAVNFNTFVIASGAQSGAQLSWAYLTLGYAVLVAIFALVHLDPPDFTIPSVLIWATIGIASELNNPKDSILASFEEGQIATVRNSVITICVALALATAGYGGYRVYKKKASREEYSQM
mmetsp:Transcript_15384/g.23008  ORF Transcript_15384/g.23008 Transcript_15384/m.23008 type:complete len:292 (+) Transcript_15384:63-938(+)